MFMKFVIKILILIMRILVSTYKINISSTRIGGDHSKHLTENCLYTLLMQVKWSDSHSPIDLSFSRNQTESVHEDQWRMNELHFLSSTTNLT